MRAPSIQDLILRDGPNCHYCLKPAVNPTREHVVPQSINGPWHESNLVLACYSCNGKRGDQLHKCTCDFCKAAEKRWMAWCLAVTEKQLQEEEARAAIFREIWSKREDDKGKVRTP